MVCGNEKNLNTILKVKTNLDSGMFYPLQAGASAALRLPKSWFTSLNKVYAERKQKILKLAKALGCTPGKDQSGMFVWAKVPEGETSEGLVNNLLYTL